jgi:hypothetical protein
VLAVRDLVEHARLGERERRLEVAVAEEADLAGVEPAEAADVGDAAVEGPCRLWTGYRAMLADGNNLVASVKRPQPVGDLPIGETRRVELGIPDREHRDANEVSELERRIGCDVDSLDRERAVEPDAPQRAMRLLAEVTPRPLVQGHRDRRLTMRAQPDEREPAPEVAAEHG